MTPDRLEETDLPEKSIAPEKIVVKAIPRPSINYGPRNQIETLSHNTSVDKLESELANRKFDIFL